MILQNALVYAGFSAIRAIKAAGLDSEKPFRVYSTGFPRLFKWNDGGDGPSFHDGLPTVSIDESQFEVGRYTDRTWYVRYGGLKWHMHEDGAFVLAAGDAKKASPILGAAALAVLVAATAGA